MNEFIPPEILDSMIDPSSPEGIYELSFSKHKILPATKANKFRKMMANSILEQAKKVMGHYQKKYTLKIQPLNLEIDQELAFEESLENHFDHGEFKKIEPEYLMIEKIIEKENKLLLILDTSLSMTLEKRKILATTIAILLIQLGKNNVEVITFNTTASHMKLKSNLLETIQDYLDIPSFGMTNFEEAFKLAHQYKKTHRSLLISDGKPTAGGDPLKFVHLVNPLDIINIGEDHGQIAFNQTLASFGQGQFFNLKAFQDLPELVFRLSLRMGSKIT